MQKIYVNYLNNLLKKSNVHDYGPKVTSRSFLCTLLVKQIVNLTFY